MMVNVGEASNTFVLYDAPASSNPLKVRFLLAELGHFYERCEVPMTRPRPASYHGLSPAGLIPTLVHGSFVLGESHSILRYLAAWSARPDLYPTILNDRARVDEFLDWFATFARPAFFRFEAAALGYTTEGGFFSVASGAQGSGRRAASATAAAAHPRFSRLAGRSGARPVHHR